MASGSIAAMAAGLSSQSLLPSGNIDVMGEHIFIDTTLFHPALIRASVDLLGADRARPRSARFLGRLKERARF